MNIFGKKISQRRRQLRETILSERIARISEFFNSRTAFSLTVLCLFSVVCSFLLYLHSEENRLVWRFNATEFVSLAAIILLVSSAVAIYILNYSPRVAQNHLRAIALAALCLLMLGVAKLCSFLPYGVYIAAGTAFACATILTIAYDQRFAMAMSMFYTFLVCLAIQRTQAQLDFVITVAVGCLTCCFMTREIRTRTKLLEVGVLASATVLMMSVAWGFLHLMPASAVLVHGLMYAVSAFLVGIFITALLPLIEKVFRIATSMTLLDYSDANQPLLRKLAMEAPGTFSHSLLIGSIAESAAEAIGANGLLCRVGAYYHDIGKVAKPRYFVENQLGQASRHEQLSPAMSQLIIVGHVKDGIELAREYRLPAVIRQFIETHHGTTLVEYFYEEAKKHSPAGQAPTEADFRYPGPKPQTKEAAIVMLADAVEGAVRSLREAAPTRIEAVVHNMAMKRLQDGQFDECELTLREMSDIESALSKALAGYYHGRIAYPKAPDIPADKQNADSENGGRNGNNGYNRQAVRIDGKSENESH